MTDDPDDQSLVPDLREARHRFLALVADVRPDLHRYCARMAGSVVEGEDIVQETLARAYYALSGADSMPKLRSWLFTLAHQRAVDHLRRHDRRVSEPLDAVAETKADEAASAEDAMAHAEALRAALSRFLDLPPAQRSCVILKDVLGHSVDEIATLLDLSVPTVKAALHRGRAGLRASAVEPRHLENTTPPKTTPAIAQYAALFNARDWDAVRAMLAEDVRLDLVSRFESTGRRNVSGYFTRYAATDWRLVPAWLEGREVLAAYHHEQPGRLSYFIELSLASGQVTAIRDFLFVPYIAVEAGIEVAEGRA